MNMTASYVVEHVALAVAALGGVLAARNKQVDLFGVVTLALVTALGGGTVRDMALGALPVIWIEDSNFLLTAVATGLVAFFVVQYLPFPRRLFLIADAAALALFTIIGAEKAIQFDATPSAAIALGVITGVAGGIIRDVLLNEMPLVFRREIYFYATASLCGAIVYVALHHTGLVHWAFAIGIALILALRLLSIRLQLTWPNLTGPLFGPNSPS